eukprot:703888-Rhodomonas_salina.1
MADHDMQQQRAQKRRRLQLENDRFELENRRLAFDVAESNAAAFARLFGVLGANESVILHYHLMPALFGTNPLQNIITTGNNGPVL